MSVEKALLSAAQIDELLAPIALYPDALVAIILPASTFPTEVVLAARYLNSRQDTEGIEAQPWDDSVKALARYPEVVKWMDENLAWTQQVGATFLLQPAAVLTGTQRLRAAAVAAGNLKTTPQQTVVVEREVIRIEPAQREVIYVPVYDPVLVYRPRPVEVYYSEPVLTFSSGYHTGLWLSYSCDWNRSTVVFINRPYRATVWQSHPVWTYRSTHYTSHHRDWCPPPSRVSSVRRDYDQHRDNEIARPSANTYVQSRPGRDSGSRDLNRPTDSGGRDRSRPDNSAAKLTPAATVADPLAPATIATTRSDRPRQSDPSVNRNTAVSTEKVSLKSAPYRASSPAVEPRREIPAAPAVVAAPPSFSAPLAAAPSTPEQRPARTEKVSLKSAPYRAPSPAATPSAEPRRQVRSGLDERLTRQTTPLAPGADLATGSEIAADADRRRDRQR
jgi:hypothetical protein